MGCHQDQLAGGMLALRCLVLCSSTMKVPSSSSRHICCNTTSRGAHICSIAHLPSVHQTAIFNASCICLQCIVHVSMVHPASAPSAASICPQCMAHLTSVHHPAALSALSVCPQCVNRLPRVRLAMLHPLTRLICLILLRSIQAHRCGCTPIMRIAGLAPC